MDIVKKLNRYENELLGLFLTFRVNGNNVSDIEKNKSSLLEYAKLAYNYYYNKMQINENQEDMFAWKKSAIKISLILIADFDIGRYKVLGFAEASKFDTIEIVDAIDHDLPYTFYKKFTNLEKISYLVQNSIISELTDDLILASAQTEVTDMHNWAKSFLLEEINNIDTLTKPSIELINFNDSIIRAKRYDLEELMYFVNNQQFTAELNECLYAYNNQKWFVCATGLGGVLEHLLYLVLEKNDMIDRSFPSNATISDYISYMKKPPVKMERRQQTMIKNIFNIRNSVSHFNQGFTSKDQCTYLMNGIKDIFDNYYNTDFSLSDN